jgi:uncharacterized protein YhfF
LASAAADFLSGRMAADVPTIRRGIGVHSARQGSGLVRPAPGLADSLLDLILSGPKRASAGSLVEYEAAGVALPAVGGRFVATDGGGQPRAVLRTTEVRVGPLSSVDDQFAWDEGEGDRTRKHWLRMHTAYFTRTFEHLGIELDPDPDVVFERFEVAYPTTPSSDCFQRHPSVARLTPGSDRAAGEPAVSEQVAGRCRDTHPDLEGAPETPEFSVPPA